VSFEDDFVESDDYLHPAGTHPWAVETWWFSFFVPERQLGGWLYALVRPNQGASAGGAWIWDGSGVEPREAPYFAHYTALPTRLERASANPLDFPSGYQVSVVAPGREYRITYADEAAGVSLSLRFTATMPPFGHKDKQPPFDESAHFDQSGRVTGTLHLRGEDLAVDCYAFRDRSWGLRSERVPPRFSYCWMAREDESFLLYATRDERPLPIVRGFLHRDGITRPVVSGSRSETRLPDANWVQTIEVAATDDEGRSIGGTARAVSRLCHPRPTSTNVISLLEWDLGGVQCWGEDQDVWSHQDWQQSLAENGRGDG
jgi:hypothetical protein